MNPLSTEVKSLIRRVIAQISEEEEPHAVGGFLRDALLGRPTKDLDITVLGDAMEVARRLADEMDGSYVVLDQPHQIARVVLQSDGEWWIDLASLQGDREHDLARRDFTIDAMSTPLSSLLEEGWTESILDPFDGRGDISNGVIRAIGDGIFQEDAIRLLRAVRLSAFLGFDIEGETFRLIQRDAPLLDKVSAERVRDEFLAILASRDAVEHVYLLDELGLLCRVLPELEEGRGITQPKEHYWTVLEHNIESVRMAEGLLTRSLKPDWVLEEVPWDDNLEGHFAEAVSDGHARGTLLKLTALLHDVAKPATKMVTPEGRTRFFGHPDQGAETARKALGRLRLSRRGREMVATQIEHHLRPSQLNQKGEMPTQRAVYRFFRSLGDTAIDTLYLSLADYLAARGPEIEREEWKIYTKVIRHALETGLHQQEEEVSSPRLVDGYEVMDAVGLKPGPILGKVLNVVEEAQATGEIASRKEALALAREVASAGRIEGDYA